jgi:hypothetical protein
MVLLMITQANFLEHDISKGSPMEQKPLIGMHFGMSNQLINVEVGVTTKPSATRTPLSLRMTTSNFIRIKPYSKVYGLQI